MPAPTTKATTEPTSSPSSEAASSEGEPAKACPAISTGTVKPMPATAAPPATCRHRTPSGSRPGPKRTTSRHARVIPASLPTTRAATIPPNTSVAAGWRSIPVPKVMPRLARAKIGSTT